MIKIGKNGRRRTVTTFDEVGASAEELLVSMSDDERALLSALGEELKGNDSNGWLHQEIERSIYHTKPVSMLQFIEDPYYLGESCTTIYDQIKQDLIDLFKRPYRRVLYTGAIGFGKCVSQNTELYDTKSGRRVKIKDMVNHVDGFCCPSYNKKNGVVESRKCFARYSGEKKTCDLFLSSGKKERFSLDHPVLTPDGYKKVSDLNKGDLVATARFYPEPDECLDISDEEVIRVAYLLTDDGTTTTSMSFTNENDDISQELNDISILLGDSGKRVPAEFYGLNNRQLSVFLNMVWSRDGWVSVGKNNNIWEIGITLGSEEFIKDIQQLLLRCGVHSRVRYKLDKYVHKGEKRERDSWNLAIHGELDTIKFLNFVGEIKGKEESCRKCLNRMEEIVGNTNLDILPLKRLDLAKLRKEIGPIKRCDYWSGIPYDQNTGVRTWKRLNAAYDSPEWCDWHGDVFWDRVSNVVETGEYEPVYDLEVPVTHNFAVGGMIVHNTFSASIVICRIIYEMSCMISPQRMFGLSTSSEMTIPLISKNLTLARQVMKSAVDDKIKESPYFMTKFTPQIRQDFTLFPNNIRVMVGSYTSDRILGTTIVSAFCDEMNFPPNRRGQQISTGFGQKKTSGHYDIVEKVYRRIVRRVESRFSESGDGISGMLVLSSSSATKESFTERIIRESMDHPDIFIRDHTKWTVKPEDFSGNFFYVLCSVTSSLKSRILNEEEYLLITDEYLDANDALILDIPEKFRGDFETDLEEALRDIAGFPIDAISVYIQRSKMVEVCTNRDRVHPFGSEIWVAGSKGEFDWDSMCSKYERRLPGGFTEEAWMPRINPGSLRWCHIDTSLSGDSSGFCVGHIDRWVEVSRTDSEGEKHADIAPYYIVDFMLKICPPLGEQIYLPDLRSMLYQFVAHGYKFIGFSTDAFMYAEMHQQVRRKGISTHLISMDRTTEPYDELKSSFYEERIEIYEYNPFVKEFKALEYDRIKGKIDHPEAGCFVGETRVKLAGGGSIKIEEMDGKCFNVKSFDGEKEVIGSAVGRMTKYVDEIIEVTLDNRKIERCTKEHLWMLEDGSYMAAVDLFEGQILKTVEEYKDMREEYNSALCLLRACGYEDIKMLVKRHVLSVKCIKLEERIPVYDLEVWKHHNFALSSGVFVHNSKDVSDGVAGVVHGLKVSGSRLPTSGIREQVSLRNKETSWVTPLIPAEDIDRDAVMGMNDQISSSSFMPIIFGDE